ncbi:MAG: hypothetical protein DSY87_00260 [Methylococcus sp.]|nr:MAG: hypothetical protein DSY87_00260 [Methylococcus sp.]
MFYFLLVIFVSDHSLTPECTKENLSAHPQPRYFTKDLVAYSLVGSPIEIHILSEHAKWLTSL